MTAEQLRQQPGYIEAKEEIIVYNNGFVFTVPLSKMPVAKRNAMNILLRDCVKEGLIESMSIGLSLSGEVVEERYMRL